ncbi:MAG: hypothetical protein PHG48_04755, partial [Eubacteriales bacterium]|nr:hypothetical protein [Eubacteriales bacterium]
MAGKNGNSCCGSSNRIDSFEKTQQELSLLQDSLGISIPSICLPSQGKSALEKWAVIACDQYTSEPE